MIKKFSVIMLFLAVISNVEAAQPTLSLPKPDIEGGIPLMEAVAKRRSTREFSAKKIDEQTLSDILYAAWGISHESKRTIPTALNKQDLRVFAALKDGVWEYDAAQNQLQQISAEDITPLLAQQNFVEDAPLTLIFTGSDSKNSPMNAAAAYQNVGLYCASRGLNNVVRGYFDRAGVAKVLNLDEDEVIITQTIGWPYM